MCIRDSWEAYCGSGSSLCYGQKWHQSSIRLQLHTAADVEPETETKYINNTPVLLLLYLKLVLKSWGGGAWVCLHVQLANNISLSQSSETHTVWQLSTLLWWLPPALQHKLIQAYWYPNFNINITAYVQHCSDSMWRIGDDVAGQRRSSLASLASTHTHTVIIETTVNYLITYRSIVIHDCPQFQMTFHKLALKLIQSSHDMTPRRWASYAPSSSSCSLLLY